MLHGQKQRRERETDAGHGERPRQRPIGDQRRRSCARAHAHPHAVAARLMALLGGLAMVASGHGDRYQRRRWLRRLGAATKWRRGMGVMRCITPPPGGLSLPYDGSWQPGHTRRRVGATAAGGGDLWRPNRVSGMVGEVRLRPRKVTAVAAWVEGSCSGDGHGARARPWRACCYYVLWILAAAAQERPTETIWEWRSEWEAEAGLRARGWPGRAAVGPSRRRRASTWRPQPEAGRP